MEHDPDCRWERTTALECEYRGTHHYCPHPAHACNCAPPAARVSMDMPARLRRLADVCVLPDFAAKLRELAVEHEAWERGADKRN